MRSQLLIDVWSEILAAVPLGTRNRGEWKSTKPNNCKVWKMSALRTGKYRRILSSSDPSLEAIEDKGVREVTKQAVYYVEIGAIYTGCHHHRM